MLLDIVGMGTAAEVVGEYQFRMPKLLALTMVAGIVFPCDPADISEI